MSTTAHLERSVWPELKGAPVWVRVGFWISILIAVAVVIRRVLAIVHPAQSGPPQMTALDSSFASHGALTLAHIIPALLFVLVTPFVFMRRFSDRTWPQRLLFPLGLIVGLTAYAMDRFAIGGWLERSAVLVFNTLFLFSLARAWLYQLRGEEHLKRVWLIRAVAVLLGIATTRPIMGVFFATSRLTQMTPADFFGIAFWLGFSTNTVLVEWWLRKRALARS